MQIGLIIGSFIAAIALIIIAIVRAKSFSVTWEDDPPFVFFIIMSLGMLFGGLHFLLSSGKTFDYADAYSLRLPVEWQVHQESDDSFDRGNNVTNYGNQDSTFSIGVSRISKASIKQFRQDVKDAEKQQAVEGEKTTIQKVNGLKWLAESDQLKAVFKNRMYTVSGTGDYMAVFKTVNVKPFGFLRGLADGYLIPVQGVGALFIPNLHPYKTPNNGFLYLLGFILGTIGLAGLLIWLIYTIKKHTDDNRLLVLCMILFIGMIFAGLNSIFSSGRSFNYTGAFSLRLPDTRQASRESDDFSGLGESVSIYANRNAVFAVGVTGADKAIAKQFKQDVKDAEKQRAARIKAITDKKLRKIVKKEKYNVQKINGVKWLAESDTQLKTVFHNRMYVVSGTGGYTETFNTLDIRPFGLFQGLIDGYLIPVQGIGALFVKTWHPYKTANNGLVYLIGFIVGSGGLVGFLIGLKSAVHKHPIRQRLRLEKEQKDREEAEQKERERKEEKERRERERKEWEAKWAAMSDEEKAEYNAEINAEKYVEEQKKKSAQLAAAIQTLETAYKKTKKDNDNTLKQLRGNYYSLEQNYGTNPEGQLQLFDQSSQKDVFDQVGNFFGDVFTGGKQGVEKAVEHYNQLTNIYNFYQKRYKASLQEVEAANAAYIYERQKASLYINQLRELFDNFNFKQKELLDQVKKTGLQNVKFDSREVQNLLNSVSKFNADYKIKAEASWDKALQVSGDIFNETSKYINKTTKKGKRGLSDEDMIVAGIGLGIGLANIAVEGIGQLIGSMEKNSEIVAQYKEGEGRLRQAITAVEVNRSKAEDFVSRANEINNYLEDAMQRYSRMFAEINTFLFPPDNQKKSRFARKKREELGGEFFTDEEADKVFALYEYGKIMATVVNAKF